MKYLIIYADDTISTVIVVDRDDNFPSGLNIFDHWKDKGATFYKVTGDISDEDVQAMRSHFKKANWCKRALKNPGEIESLLFQCSTSFDSSLEDLLRFEDIVED